MTLVNLKKVPMEHKQKHVKRTVQYKSNRKKLSTGWKHMPMETIPVDIDCGYTKKNL